MAPMLLRVRAGTLLRRTDFGPARLLYTRLVLDEKSSLYLHRSLHSLATSPFHHFITKTHRNGFNERCKRPRRRQEECCLDHWCRWMAWWCSECLSLLSLCIRADNLVSSLANSCETPRPPTSASSCATLSSPSLLRDARTSSPPGPICATPRMSRPCSTPGSVSQTQSTVSTVSCLEDQKTT